MDGSMVPHSPAKDKPPSTTSEEVNTKSEVVSKPSDGTNNFSFQEAFSQKIETVTDRLQEPLDIKACPDSQIELRTTTIPESEESSSSFRGDSAENEKVVMIGNSDEGGTSTVDDGSTDRTIEEGVSKAVTELKLDQTEESDKMVDRLQPEIKSNETKDVIEEENWNDPVVKDTTELNNEVPMDVDPPETDNSASAQGGRDGVEGNVKKYEIPEMKEEDLIEEDLIDETWKSDDFNLPPSDDEGNLFWEPPSEVIVELYQKLDEGKILELEWTCLGRRTPEEDGDKMEVEDVVEDNQEESVDQPAEEDPTEFDFDIDVMLQKEVTPRRIPGFEPKGSGSAKRRVAKMENILDDIRRFSKINEEMEKTGDKALPLPTDLEVTPQRPLGKFHIRRDLHQ